MALPAYARALAGVVRAGGAFLMITREVRTLGPTTEPLGGLRFLFHNVVVLRYIEIDSEIRRVVSILKLRDSNHEKRVREFQIGANGMQVMERLEGVTGVLGWSGLREESSSSPP